LSETAKFTDDILTVARERARQVVDQAENERQRLVDDAKATIAREANDTLRNAQAEAEGIRRREVSEVRHKVKLQEQSEKDKILSAVLDEAKAKVREITRDENKYLAYLARLGADAIRQLGMERVTVHLNADDLKRIDVSNLTREIDKHAPPGTKVEISKEPISASGGIIVSNQDGKVRIVNTFEQRFEALESKLLIEAGRLLFSEN
jgi:vacuolar-type H+-ATPase subunit E/Vma4